MEYIICSLLFQSKVIYVVYYRRFGDGIVIKKVKYEEVFYSLLILFVAVLILSESQFNELGAIGATLKIIKSAIIAAIALFSITRNRSVKRDLFVSSFILISALVFNLIFNDGGMSIIPLIMVVWASKNYSIEKTFRYTFITILVTYMFVFACSILGVLKDNVQFVIRGIEAGSFFAGEYNRHSYGFLVHNQIAIAFFILYMFYIAIRRDKIRWYESLIVMMLNLLILRFFGSRIIFILTVLACIGYYIERGIQKYSKKNKASKAFILAFPVCCALSLIICINYNYSSMFYRALDLLFSNRVRLSNEAISSYGIHLLGAGQYAGTYNSTVLSNNTVDNGYISFIIQNGLIAGVMIIGVWTYITYIAVKNHNRFLMLTLTMIAIENIVNPHLGSYLLVPFFSVFVNIKDSFVTNKEVANVFGFKRMKRKHSQKN